MNLLGFVDVIGGADHSAFGLTVRAIMGTALALGVLYVVLGTIICRTEPTVWTEWSDDD